jgi:long-chain acyl-CoA synthetase
MKKWLVDTALESKLYYIRNNQGHTHRVWDKLVF